MKILLINGSVHANGNCDFLIKAAEKVISAHGAESERYDIGTAPRCACIGCGKCKYTNGCFMNDLDDAVKKASDADAFAVFTPTYYASAVGNLTSVLSRLFMSGSEMFRFKPVTVIGTGRRGCISEAIHEITRFFEFMSCPVIFGRYPAICYSGKKENAKFDSEGIQNTEEAIEALLWLTEVIKLGERNNIAPPIWQGRKLTDISSLSSKISEMS